MAKAILDPVVRSLRIAPQSRQTDFFDEKAVRMRMKIQPKKMMAMMLGLAWKMSFGAVLRLWHLGQGRPFFTTCADWDDSCRGG